MLDENSIIELPISSASAFTKRYVNGNEYTTNGFELIVSATSVKNKNFTWNVATNWSSNIRKLTGIYGDQEKFGDLKKVTGLMLCMLPSGKDTGWPVDIGCEYGFAHSERF